MRNSRWLRLLAYVTGSVNQELLLRNEYLAAENRILRTRLPARLRLSKPERITLTEIGKRLGRKALREVCRPQKPRPESERGDISAINLSLLCYIEFWKLLILLHIKLQHGLCGPQWPEPIR